MERRGSGLAAMVVLLVCCAGCSLRVETSPQAVPARHTHHAIGMDIRAKASEVNAETKKVLQEMGVEVLSEKTTNIDGLFTFKSATSPEISIVIQATSAELTDVLIKYPTMDCHTLADVVYQELFKRMVWPGKPRT